MVDPNSKNDRKLQELMKVMSLMVLEQKDQHLDVVFRRLAVCRGLSAVLCSSPQVLIDWINDVLVGERIIVKDLAEDLYDGQVLQKLFGEEVDHTFR